MIYFSELDKNKVYATNGKCLGNLDDLIFSVVGIPYIKKIVVKAPNSRSIFDLFEGFPNKGEIIPIEYLQKLEAGRLIIDKNFKKSSIEENELYVGKNLLDTQVIDIEGNNVVRVNDVLIQTTNSHGFIIYGVDIGWYGLLRWFKLDKFINKIFGFFGKHYLPKTTLPWSDIQPLELTRGRVVVNSRFNRLKKLHPADLADYLETQNLKNASTLIEGIDKEYLADVISELNPNFQINLLKEMPLDKVAKIISVMDPDDAVDVISEFSKKKQESIIKRLPDKEASQIRRLFKFSGSPIGKLLNPDFLTVYPEQTVSEVFREIKDYTTDFSFLNYVYVVNKENQLIGVFNLRELIMQPQDKPMFQFMSQRVVVTSLNTPVEVAFRRMIKYKLSSLPVVDDKKRIIGVISSDDLGEEVIKKLA